MNKPKLTVAGVLCLSCLAYAGLVLFPCVAVLGILAQIPCFKGGVRLAVLVTELTVLDWFTSE